MPGDIITEVDEITQKERKIILGPGLRKHEDKIVASKAGHLQSRPPATFWIDTYQKRYVPTRGESVVGVVVQKSGDIFRVDIGSSEPASLSYLAFEGATKKNRPDVNVGDLLFAKLLIASKDLEPELVCVDSHGKKGKMGVLADGFVFNCSINLVRKILHEKCPLLNALKKEAPFEIAAGMNGRVWIKAKTIKETIAVGNAILAAEFVPNEEIPNMCDRVGCYMVGLKG